VSRSFWRGWFESLAQRLRTSDFGYELGLVGFVSLGSMLRMADYLVRVHPAFIPRLLLVVTASVVSVPLRLLERIRYGARVDAVRLSAPPIFIIGHWRSGTTHLHNLLSQDPALGCVSMYQAMVPNCSLVAERWLKPLLAAIVPRKRPMDNMVWPVEAPQEEEIPLAKLTPYSFYVRSLFPMESADLFRRYVLLDGSPLAIEREIAARYRRILQVATIHAGGRRLVLKNPVNTARIRLLLEWFPDAKFVHAVRCPYEVFASTVHLHARVLPLTTLQRIPLKPSSPIILSIYEDMMRRFLEDRDRIPPGNFVEVRFEDLERDPLGEIRRVYNTLGLSGLTQAEPAIRAYVDSQRAYQKNRLELSEEDRRDVTERWAFAFRAFAYASDSDVADDSKERALTT
jgi:omega-hydroxy-beta-dihydromenaquinone-9 sulfotransferase